MRPVVKNKTITAVECGNFRIKDWNWGATISPLLDKSEFQSFSVSYMSLKNLRDAIDVYLREKKKTNEHISI